MFKRLSLANAFLLAIILPMLLALSTLAFYLADKFVQLEAAREASHLLITIEKLDEVARAHAVERGLTAGFLASGGERFSADLRIQRSQSDDAIAALQALESQGLVGIPESTVRRIFDPVFNLAANIPTLRSNVDALNAPNAFNFYSNINAAALDGMVSVNAEVDNQRVTRSLNALIAALWSRERLGQIRGRLNAYYASAEADQVAFIRVSQYISNLADQRRVFDIFAPESAKTGLREIRESSEYQKMQSALDAFLASGGTQRLDDPTGGQWFEVATAALEQYGDLGKVIYRDTVTVADDNADTLSQEVFFHSVASAGVLALFSGLIFSIARRVRRTLLQNNMLVAAVEASPVGLLITNPQRRDMPITYVNAGFTHITGYSRDDVLGKNCRFLQGPGTDPGKVVQIREAIRQEQEISLELLNYRKDGTAFWNLLLVSPVFDPNQTLIAYVGIQQDTTERKRLDRMKDEFVSTVSHELRTPLTSISGSLGLVLGGAAGEVPPKAKEMLMVAQRNGTRLARLINDLLDFEKIAAEKLTFTMARHDIGELVTQSIEANKQYGADRRVQLAFTRTPEPVMVHVDEDRLQQVLSNLLSNAIKFSPDGEQVQVTVSVMGEQVRVSVRDAGPGVPESFRERIFEKFAQAESSSTRPQGGTGLGLAISQELIIRMGGTIDFQSTEGRGSVFWFDLPIVEEGVLPR